MSDCFIISSGAPQGSYPEPLLILMFIDDIVITLRQIKIENYRYINSVFDRAALQEGLDRIDNWCNNNNMQLNTKKKL